MADRSERLSRAVEAPPGPVAEAPTGSGLAVDASRRVGRSALLALAVGIVAFGSAVWLFRASAPADQGGPAARPKRLFTVTPGTMRSRLTITGTVTAGKIVAVMAPFDGVVRERGAELGDRVAAGDVLLVMEVGEMQGRLREAQAALLKAAMAAEQMKRWNESPDVMRMRRVLEAAEAGLIALDRQVVETKALLDRGIVSRNEYDSLVRQRDGQRVSVAGSRQDLQTTLDRGNADNRRVAELDLANARARLTDLQQQLDGATIVAAAAGILARPAASRNGRPLVAIEPGSRVTRGQPLFTIADTVTFVIAGKADEVDVNHIRVGQAVSITSDAFPGAPIGGQVVSVSAEANEDQNARVPSFEVRAAFSGDQAARHPFIRLGMSARMTIDTKNVPVAVVVPVEAIRDAATSPMVRLRDPRSGEERDRPVVLGATDENGVEVLNGLEPGDVLVVR